MPHALKHIQPIYLLAYAACITCLAEALYQNIPPTYSLPLHLCFAFYLALACAALPTSAPFCATLWISGTCSFYIWRDLFLQQPVWLPASIGVFAYTCYLIHPLHVKMLSFKHKSLMPLAAILAAVALAHATLFMPSTQHTHIPSHKKHYKGKGVVLVVADTFRADVLEDAFWQPYTPFLRSLRDQSTVFPYAYAQSSWTKPSISSILTSLLPSEHRTIHKYSSFKPPHTSLQKHLQQNGVHTGLITANYNISNDFGFNDGFDFYTYVPPEHVLNAPAYAHRIALYSLVRTFLQRFFPSQSSESYYASTHRLETHIERFLNTYGDEPFFLMVHCMEPHDPYAHPNGSFWSHKTHPHPKPSQASAMKEAYAYNIQKMDAALKRVFGFFEASVSNKNTLFMFTSDHGESFNEHSTFYHGSTLYDEQTHIPFWIMPSTFAKTEISRLVQHIDIAPTVSSWFALPANPAWTGCSLTDTSQKPDVAIAETFHEGIQLRSVRYKKGSEHLKYHFIQSHGFNPNPSELLYDLSQDPKEEHPLSNPTLLQTIKNKHLFKKTPTEPHTTESIDLEQLKSLGYVK